MVRVFRIIDCNRTIPAAGGSNCAPGRITHCRPVCIACYTKRSRSGRICNVLIPGSDRKNGYQASCNRKRFFQHLVPSLSYSCNRWINNTVRNNPDTFCIFSIWIIYSQGCKSRLNILAQIEPGYIAICTCSLASYDQRIRHSPQYHATVFCGALCFFVT